MSDVLSVKVDKEKLKELEEIARAEQSDRSAVARRLLDAGIRDWKVRRAVETFQAGKASLWKASSESGLSLREFMEVLERRRVVTVGITPAELERELDAMAGDS